MLIFDLIIITIIVSFFNIFKAYLFDEEFLAIQGAPILLFRIPSLYFNCLYSCIIS